MDKISIIIPFHNASKYIQNCIDCLKKQTYSNFEAIFINDESYRTLAFYLSTLASGVGNTVAGQGMAAAASLIMFAPNLIFFVIVQSKVMDTMAHSGIK